MHNCGRTGRTQLTGNKSEREGKLGTGTVSNAGSCRRGHCSKAASQNSEPDGAPAKPRHGQYKRREVLGLRGPGLSRFLANHPGKSRDHHG